MSSDGHSYPVRPSFRIPVHGHTSPRDGGAIPDVLTGTGGGSGSGSGSTGSLPAGTAGQSLTLASDGTTAQFVHQWINAEDWGAVHDDTTDDTTALSGAISATGAGSSLYIPTGTYKITSDLAISQTNAQILGAGDQYGGSIIHQHTANTSALSFSAAFTTADVSASLVRNLVVQGPSGGSSGNGIYALADLIVENVGVYGFYDGIFFDNKSFYSRMSGCLVTDNAHAGVVGVGTNNLIVRDSRINGYHASSVPPFGNQPIGVLVQGVLMVRIEDCAIEACDTAAIQVEGNSSVNPISTAIYMPGTYFGPPAATNGRYIYLKGSSGHLVRAVTIVAPYLEGNSASGFWAIDGEYAVQVTIIGGSVGYGTAIAGAIRGDANSSGWKMLNVDVVSGTVSLPANSSREDAATGWPIVDPTSTRGDLIVRNNAGALIALHLGAANTVLHGSSTDPAYSAVVEADLSLSAVTTGNVNTTRHGFAPVLPNDATKYLDGTGNFSTPVGSGGATDHEHIDNVIFSGDGSTTDFVLPAAPFDAYSVSVFVAGTRSQDWTLTGALLDTLHFGSAPASSADNIAVDIVAATS